MTDVGDASAQRVAIELVAIPVSQCVFGAIGLSVFIDGFLAYLKCLEELGIECTDEELYRRMKTVQLYEWVVGKAEEGGDTVEEVLAAGGRLLCDVFGLFCESASRLRFNSISSAAPRLPSSLGFDVELHIASSDPSVLDVEFVGDNGETRFIPMSDSGKGVVTLWGVHADTGEPLPVALQFPFDLGNTPVTGTGSFTDDPIRPGVTPIRAVHFTELRMRIGALRAGAGLPRFPWADAVLRAGVTPVKGEHLLELRAALAEAYLAARRAEPAWTDVAPVLGATPIRAAHLMELRAAVVALE